MQFVAAAAAPFPGPSTDQRLDELSEQIDQLQNQLQQHEATNFGMVA